MRMKVATTDDADMSMMTTRQVRLSQHTAMSDKENPATARHPDNNTSTSPRGT